MGLSEQNLNDMVLIGVSLILIFVLYNFIENIEVIAFILFAVLISMTLCNK